MKKCIKYSLKSAEKRVKAVLKTSEKCVLKNWHKQKNMPNYEQIQKNGLQKTCFPQTAFNRMKNIRKESAEFYSTIRFFTPDVYILFIRRQKAGIFIFTTAFCAPGVFDIPSLCSQRQHGVLFRRHFRGDKSAEHGQYQT